MELKDKTVLVTGSAKRVGKTIALTLAKRGANLIINYQRSRSEAEDTVQEVEKLGARSLAVRANVSVVNDVQAMIRQAVKHFGRLDVLVNNAAIFYPTPFDRLTEKDWDEMININLKGSFLCAKYAADEMLKSGGGKIINIADWSGIRPYVDYLPYCVSKSGVIALTKALAVTLAPTIQVNCVAPGPVMLPGDFTDQDRAEVLAKTPLKRTGSPEDIANTVKFLIEGSDFMTGAMIAVDGGRLIA
jgi:NAD(P)-dependent dehydrogenase (short-subunit alcohol dehydrogenase family)